MMNLSSEDSLRLNVLLKQELLAVRIDESKMTVLALTTKGEACVVLNPNCRDEAYLKQVRELFSTHVIGSPGGYPVYLKRWTRMGQARENDSLLSLLKLGEPEAVVAVVHTPDLTPELASLAWWAMPEAESARCMLASPEVVVSEIGRELAAFLIEYLPFETEPVAIFDTVRLVLQPGLVSEVVRQKLWQRAARKGSIYVGFLQAIPDGLPELVAAHSKHEAVTAVLSGLLGSDGQNDLQQGLLQDFRQDFRQDNALARLLCRVTSPSGQTFLKTVTNAMEKLADESAAVALFDVIGNYFHVASPVGHPGAIQAGRNSETAVTFSQVYVETLAKKSLLTVDQSPSELAQVLGLLVQQTPYSKTPETSEVINLDLQAMLKACVALSFASESLLDSFFAHSDAVGPLMRRKMKPWIEPMLAQINVLQS